MDKNYTTSVTDYKPPTEKETKAVMELFEAALKEEPKYKIFVAPDVADALIEKRCFIPDNVFISKLLPEGKCIKIDDFEFPELKVNVLASERDYLMRGFLKYGL